MSIRDRITGVFAKIRKAAEQLYTPRELRAVLLFISLGLCMLLYRSGKQIYYAHFPERADAVTRQHQHQQDSLFHALSAIADRRDSLFFSLPEDSLLPAGERKKLEHHSKEEGLRPGVISLNAGGKEDFMRLPGVGSATAERILEYRSQRGKFRKLEEMQNIKGFGEKRFAKIRRYLRLD